MITSLGIWIAERIKRYEPGDVAVIHPVASVTDVDALLDALGWQDVADERCEIVQEPNGNCFFLFLVSGKN